MDFIAVAKIIVRRWFIAAPILLLTVVAATVVYSRMEHTYMAEGEVMLASPAAVVDQIEQPLTGGTDATGDSAADGNVHPTPLNARVVGELVTSGSVRDRLQDRGATATWDLDIDNDASIIRVTASSANRNDVVPTVQEVLKAIEQVVTERQERLDLPESTRVAVEVLATPTTPQEKSQESGVEYFATGSAMLAGSSPSSDIESAYGASQFTAQVLERVMRSDQAREKVAALGAQSGYEIKIDRRDTANIFYISTTGADADNVVASFGSVVTVLEGELFSRQEGSGVEAGSTARIDPLSVPTTARDVSSNQLRGIIVILGLGVAAAFSLALLAEGMLSRRRPQPTALRRMPPAEEEARVLEALRR